MNGLNTILTAIGGTSAIGGLLTALIAYLKARTTALKHQQVAQAEHLVHDQKLADMQISIEMLAANLTAAQTETALLRAERDAWRKKAEKLEAKNNRLVAALPPYEVK